MNLKGCGSVTDIWPLWKYCIGW